MQTKFFTYSFLGFRFPRFFRILMKISRFLLLAVARHLHLTPDAKPRVGFRVNWPARVSLFFYFYVCHVEYAHMGFSVCCAVVHYFRVKLLIFLIHSVFESVYNSLLCLYFSANSNFKLSYSFAISLCLIR